MEEWKRRDQEWLDWKRSSKADGIAKKARLRKEVNGMRKFSDLCN